jgi:hypothetical protein
MKTSSQATRKTTVNDAMNKSDLQLEIQPGCEKGSRRGPDNKEQTGRQITQIAGKEMMNDG